MLRSQLCSAESLRSPALRAWAERLRPMWAAGDDAREVMLHRKMWEWLFIAEALRERGMLAAGRRGSGSAWGRSRWWRCSPPPAVTSSPPTSRTRPPWPSGWTDSEVEWAGGLENLNEFGLCAAEEFEQRVDYRPVDMNAIPADLRGFDFTWSSCALEHLGTLAAGMDFVVAQMDCLRPGGVAVHTTEFLVSSNDGHGRGRRDRLLPAPRHRGRWWSACGGRATTSTWTTRRAPRPTTSTSTCRPTPTCTCAPSWPAT